MVNIKKKLATLQSALDTLKDGIERVAIAQEEKEGWELTARDSMIQRFEYCTDLLWKMLKVYLEEVENVKLESTSPKGIIREAVQIRILSEQEGEQCVQMIKNRNETSHIYREEIAEHIAARVPAFFDLMQEMQRRIEMKVQ